MDFRLWVLVPLFVIGMVTISLPLPIEAKVEFLGEVVIY